MTSLSGTTLVLSAISEGHLYGTWYQPKDGFQESDLKWKYDIEDLNAKYSEMFDYLRPVRYKYKHGTSGRYHTGFIAQEVKYAIEKAGMTTKEVASYGENIL